MVTKTKEVSLISLGQGRAGLKCKIKTPLPTSIDKPIVQAREKTTEQPKAIVPETPRKVVPIPNYAIPHLKSKDNSGSRIAEREAIWDVSREIPIHSDPVYKPLLKLVKTTIPKIPGSLFDIDPELHMDFEENLQFQEGVISETYQRPDKSYL